LWPLPPGEADTEALVGLYAYPQPLDRPHVRVNFVSSVDGAVTLAGRSGGLSSEADQDLFALLRALADVVFVGAGTARVEGYHGVRYKPSNAALRKRLGLSGHAPIAVVSGSAAIDPDGGLITDTAVPTIVFTTEDAPAERRQALAAAGADVVVAGKSWVDPAVAVAELGARGLCRVLCEGGPRLLGDLVMAGLVDEMCLTVAPVLLAGPAGRIAHGLGAPAPLGLRLASALHDNDNLLLRYVRTGEGAAT
jgi:5-amino-6-(5-phosphoribosylamino)uracil reductase